MNLPTPKLPFKLMMPAWNSAMPYYLGGAALLVGFTIFYGYAGPKVHRHHGSGDRIHYHGETKQGSDGASGSQRERMATTTKATERTTERTESTSNSSAEELYAQGRELDEAQNSRQGYQLVDQAARMGNKDAQAYLGYMTAEGRGTAQSHDKARGWFLKAAKAGDPYAQNYLGYYYEEGHGVGIDLVEAYKWYALSATGGYADGIQNRDELKPKLKPEQLREAQERMRSFKR